MAKQAMGTIALNEYERMDGLIYTLVYPQKPMVKSRTLDLVNFDNIPGGQNACIAVMSYSGYDIEDAIILNKAAIDRGYGRCMVLRKHQTSVRRYANGTMDRTLGPPDPAGFADGELDKRYVKYQAIDQDGICRVGELLEPGFIMCNKESPTDTTTNITGANFGFNSGLANPHIQYKPSNLTFRGGAPSYVDKVLITSNEHEQFLIKVMLRQVRRPEIGDKFASRHGQKGVCGLIVQEQDLPFSELGQVPDLIMNPCMDCGIRACDGATTIIFIRKNSWRRPLSFPSNSVPPLCTCIRSVPPRTFSCPIPIPMGDGSMVILIELRPKRCVR